MRYDLTVSTYGGGDKYVFRNCSVFKVLFELLKVHTGTRRIINIEPL